MSVMEQLINDIKSLTTDKPQTFYCCQGCGHTYPSAEVPEVCPSCKATAYQWPGDTAEEAKSRADRAKGITNAPTTTPEPSPSVEPAPTAAPNPPATTRKPRAARKTEEKLPEQPAASTPATSEQSTDTVDFTAAREAAVAAFIEKHRLNEIQPLPVGHVTVQTVGFTLWLNKRPVYRFHESVETGKEFMEAYNEARAEQPALAIDVARCSDCDNPELEACLYRGDVVVGLNSGHGTKQVRRGDRIKIGALRTSTGKIRFVMI
jgi:hypothetical protein